MPKLAVTWISGECRTTRFSICCPESFGGFLRRGRCRYLAGGCRILRRLNGRGYRFGADGVVSSPATVRRDLVACRMAVGVVDLFEVVDVEHDESGGVALAFETGRGFFSSSRVKPRRVVAPVR